MKTLQVVTQYKGHTDDELKGWLRQIFKGELDAEDNIKELFESGSVVFQSEIGSKIKISSFDLYDQKGNPVRQQK